MADPNQTFIVSVLTREQIADDLNSYLEYMEYAGDGLTADDDRLTDAICLKYAADMNDVATDGDYTEDGREEAVAEIQFGVLGELGFDLSSLVEELPQDYLLVVTHADDDGAVTITTRSMIQITSGEAGRLAARANDLFARNAAGNGDDFTLHLGPLRPEERWNARDFEDFLDDFERERVPRKFLRSDETPGDAGEEDQCPG